METLAKEVAYLTKNSQPVPPLVDDGRDAYLSETQQDMQQQVLQVKSGVLKNVTRIEQVRTEFEDKIRVIKTHNNIDNEV